MVTSSAAFSKGNKAYKLADRTNVMTNNNPFDVVKYKIANSMSVLVMFWTDSTGFDITLSGGDARRYPAQWTTMLGTSGRVPKAYTIQRMCWDSYAQAIAWGSDPIQQWGTGYTPTVTFQGTLTTKYLTVTDGSVLSIGQNIVMPTLPVGTYITAGSGSSWTLNNGVTTAITTATTGYAMADQPPLTWTTWQCTVGGTIPNYFMGKLFQSGIVNAGEPDALIMAHGINTAGFYATQNQNWVKPYRTIKDIFVAAIEQFRVVHPTTPILMTTQHPVNATGDGPSGAGSYRPAIIETAMEHGCAYDDTVFQTYLTYGTPGSLPASLYNGDIYHESTDIGCGFYNTMLNQWYDAAIAAPSRPQPRSNFATFAGERNLLVNGTFDAWANTSAAPDSWAMTTINPTMSKDTTYWCDDRKQYSVRLVAPSGTGTCGISQVLNASTVVPYLRGRTITIAVKLRAETNTTNYDLGRLGIAAHSTLKGTNLGWNSASGLQIVNMCEGFRWVVQTVKLPMEIDTLQIFIYGSLSYSADGAKGIWIDQAVLVPGHLPMAARP